MKVTSDLDESGSHGMLGQIGIIADLGEKGGGSRGSENRQLAVWGCTGKQINRKSFRKVVKRFWGVVFFFGKLFYTIICNEDFFIVVKCV